MPPENVSGVHAAGVDLDAAEPGFGLGADTPDQLPEERLAGFCDVAVRQHPQRDLRRRAVVGRAKRVVAAVQYTDHLTAFRAASLEQVAAEYPGVAGSHALRGPAIDSNVMHILNGAHCIACPPNERLQKSEPWRPHTASKLSYNYIRRRR
jgi:hypothetical protein